MSNLYVRTGCSGLRDFRWGRKFSSTSK